MRPSRWVLRARQHGTPLYRALQEASQQPLESRFYAPSTIEEWFYRFRHGQFAALYDQSWCDKGRQCVFDPAATEALRRLHPELTLQAPIEEMLRRVILQPGTYRYSTLQRRLSEADLDRPSLKKYH